MSRYAVRRLEGGFWLDAAVVELDGLERDGVPALLERLVSDGTARCVPPAVFCVVRKLRNGRERRVGGDVVVGRDGRASSAQG